MARIVFEGEIYEQIVAMRAHNGWTQAELANKLGKPQSTVARLESATYGRYNISTLREIAEVFGAQVQISFSIPAGNCAAEVFDAAEIARLRKTVADLKTLLAKVD